MNSQSPVSIYLLCHRSLPAFKIGISADPLRRVLGLNEPVSLKDSVEFEAASGGAKIIERYLHHRFRDALYSGMKGAGHTEWFSLDALESVRAYLTKNRRQLGLSTPRPILERLRNKTRAKVPQDQARAARRRQFRRLSHVIDDLASQAAIKDRRRHIESLNLDTISSLSNLLKEAWRERTLVGLIHAGWVFDRTALVFSGPRSEHWKQKLAGGGPEAFLNILVSFPGNISSTIFNGAIGSDSLSSTAVFVDEGVLSGTLSAGDLTFPHSSDLAEIIRSYRLHPVNARFSESRSIFRRLMVNVEGAWRQMERDLEERDRPHEFLHRTPRIHYDGAISAR